MGVVSTGQITLYDHNDAAPVTAIISASKGLTQVYTKDESSTSYNPNYASTANVLTAYVYVNGVNIVGNLSNRKWGTTLGSTDLGTNVSTINKTTNIDPANPIYNIYFEGDYTDPVTGLVTHVNAMLSLNCVKAGSNAVYVLVRGQTAIEKAASGAKNTAQIFADLMRVTGVDDTSVTYKWFVSPYAPENQLDANHALVSGGKITFKTTAGVAATNPADGTWADVKSIVIREDAITDIGLFQVQAKDADSNIFTANFVVYDVSDPYDVKVNASNGQVFQNGNGSKNLTFEVWYGGTKVTDISAYTFTAKLYDKEGAKSGFIDTTRTSAAKAVSANTAGITGNVTHAALSSALVAGDVIRLISADGLTIKSYEVGSGSTTTTTVLRSPVNGFSSSAPTANQFAGGKMWVYAGNGATAGQKTTTGTAALAVTGDDIDGMGVIYVDANNPNY
ncbi:conserved hypothetical protein [uncultured Spirochaetota bacterium]|jgi:hypothetical protein|nr:conserved hypothetical protein [uncultured Spirochaetota bacterium]